MIGILRKVLYGSDDELVSREQFDESIEHEREERKNVSLRLNALETDLRNLGRVKQLPKPKRG